MAGIADAAAALALGKSGTGISPGKLRRSTGTGLLQFVAGIRFVLAGALACLVVTSPALAASNKVRITNLSDVSFGPIANLGVDATRSQNVCLFSDTNSNGYNITATGIGPGGTFQLASGPSALAFEVQWGSSSGQSSGIQLTPNVPLTGQVSTATQQTCNNGPPTSASLIILLRSATLSGATAGTYSGTLTLVVGAE